MMHRFFNPEQLSLAQAASVLPLNAEQAMLFAQEAIAYLYQEKDVLLSLSQEVRTYENTVLAYDRIVGTLFFAALTLETYQMLSGDIAHRSKPFELMKKVWIELLYDQRLYIVLSEYAEQGKSLSVERRYYLDMVLTDMRREGFCFSSEKFSEICALQRDIAQTHVVYGANINEDVSHIAVAVSELSGLSDSFIASLPRDDQGRALLYATYPNHAMILSCCDSVDIRKQFLEMYVHRAYPKNESVLLEMITKRKQLADLLGYSSYAAFSIEHEMISSVSGGASVVDAASDFLRATYDAVRPSAQAYHEEMIADLPSGIELVDGKIAPWDVLYVEALQEQKLGYDDQKIAEYFSVEQTVKGIIDIYAQFMSLSFEYLLRLPDEIRGDWHESVGAIVVKSKDGSQILGYVFLDLHPRPYKYNHACCCVFTPAIEWQAADGVQCGNVGITVIIANFPAPTADKPGLLSHDNVTVFFHEFGHALHVMLGRTEHMMTTGTRVKRDYLELPSQILEEWMWDAVILKRVGRHYQTGEPLSDDMIAKMLSLYHKKDVADVIRRLSLSELSLRLHADLLPYDLQALMQEILAHYYPYRLPIDDRFYTIFWHMIKYDARYYGYLFSRSYALDVLSEIFAEGEQNGESGLLSSRAGDRFVREVLRPSGSCKPFELLRCYLKRTPRQDAFFNRLRSKQ